MALLVILKSVPKLRRLHGAVLQEFMIHHIISLASDPLDGDAFVMIRVADGEVVVASLSMAHWTRRINGRLSLPN